MPSRQRKQPENRRRTGCFQCKGCPNYPVSHPSQFGLTDLKLDKHVQCTEEKPSCKRCQRLGLKCQRGIKLLFREDAIQRGIQFGREGIYTPWLLFDFMLTQVIPAGTWSKRCKRIRKPPVLKLDDDFTGVPLEEYVGRWIWLNTTYDDFTGEENGWNPDSPSDTLLQIDGIKVERGRFIQGDDLANNHYLERRPLGSPFGHYTYREGYLLDYFIHGIGPSCSLSRSNNPYMSLVPLLSHKTLRNTILAVSANQLFLLGNTVCSQEDFMYKDRALKGLQNEIKSSTLEFETVAAILMMCFHDVCFPLAYRSR